MENKKLTRSNNRMLAGVCAGLADYFGTFIKYYKISQLIHTQSIAN